MDVRAHNRAAWDKKVVEGNPWTVPVSPEVVERARAGLFELLLTPTKAVPMSWFGELKGRAVLCLASGGGQQGPLLSAAGARVTVLDNSPSQLGQDRLVAEREGLEIETIEGDMSDLSMLADESFDLIVHPCSNCFVPEVRPVWRECLRVLREGGLLLAGFTNPVRFVFDYEELLNGNLEVRHSIPYSDLTQLSEAEMKRLVLEETHPLAFAHTLTDQIGGQLDAGFMLSGMYEDGYPASRGDPISRYLESFIATRGVKGWRSRS